MTPGNLFVGGLHRSGTSLITRAIAAHPAIASFEHTDAIEQEGQFLQSVLPTDMTWGGPGRFAFVAGAHLTEASALATATNAAQLAAEWARHHETGRSWLAEKSPPNLLRTRLLQAMFPAARFILVTRHPIPVALASQSWTHTSPFSLIAHWVRAHELLAQDMPHLRHVLHITYEDFVADPAHELGRVWDFIGLDPIVSHVATDDRNRAYFKRWQRDFVAPEPPAPEISEFWRKLRKKLKIASARKQRLDRFEFGRRSDARDAVAAFEEAVRGFGYSLTDFTLSPRGGLFSTQIGTPGEIAGPAVG